MYKNLSFVIRADGDIRAKMKTTISNWAYNIDQEHVIIFNFLALASVPLRIQKENNYIYVTWVLPANLKDFLREKFKGASNVELNF